MYEYRLRQASDELGCGWRLCFLCDGVEIGSMLFRSSGGGAVEGLAWWDQLTERERGRWMAAARSIGVHAAWAAYQLAEAYAGALTTGAIWLARKNSVDDSNGF